MQDAIHFVVKMNVAPENVEKFKALAAPLVESSRQEEGNIFYSLCASKKDPNQLIFVECWKDKAAIAFHNDTAQFQKTLPQLLELCITPPTKETYIEL